MAGVEQAWSHLREVPPHAGFTRDGGDGRPHSSRLTRFPALRFGVLKGVVDEIADALIDQVVLVPSNPVGLDAQGNLVRLLPEGQSSGEVVAGWLPARARLAMAFGTISADLFESSSNRSPEPAVVFT